MPHELYHTEPPPAQRLDEQTDKGYVMLAPKGGGITLLVPPPEGSESQASMPKIVHWCRACADEDVVSND